MKAVLMIITLQTFRVTAYSAYKECILESSPKVRTFSSLLEYQSNKIGFDANHSDFLGNVINFDFVSIDKLVKNAFITFQSDFLIGLNLSGKEIQEVDDGAFTTLFCLHFLDLSQNKIVGIRKASFQGLENLKNLNLSNNRIAFLPEFVFAELKHVEVLDISGNGLKGIDSLALRNVPNVKELNLDNNRLINIPQTCFRELRQTKVLNLHSNHLKVLILEDFIEMNSLETIDLSGNEITDIKFVDVKYESLHFLNLSNNSLDDFDVASSEQNFPYLAEVDLNENKFLCPDLEVILANLKARNVNVTKGRMVHSTHQISDIFCEEYLTTSIPISSTTIKQGLIPSDSEPWKSIKLHRYLAHSATNWLILLFCIIAGLGMVFVLDFFFAKGSLFNECNRAASRGRYAAPPPEYVPLN